ncbi:MAG: hypothetical protein OER86_00580 [Phycisphaerae bacterium]|nr:hypothetical protein [Phycisphaerae bacterium]
MEQLIRQYAANVNVAGLSMGVSPKIVVGAIAREPVWTKSLATVASDEQRKHLQDVAGHRDTLRRKACVEYCLSLVDRDLVLNDGQRKKLRDVIAKTLESKNLDLVNPRYESLHLMATVYKVPQESVQSILNQYQLTIWKNQAKRISRYGSMGVSRPGGPWAELLKPAVPKKTAAPKTKE